jgi:hypothetical protein
MRSPSVPRPSTSGRSRSSWARTAWVVQLPVAGEPGRLQAAQHRPHRPQAAGAGGGRPGPAQPRPLHGLVHPAHQALVLRTAAPHSGRAVERATSPPAPGLEPGRSSWIQRDDQTTLLIVRLRNQWRPSPGNFLIGWVVTEPAHFVLERKILKTRALPGGLRPWARATTAVRPSSGPSTAATLAWSGQRAVNSLARTRRKSDAAPGVRAGFNSPVLPQQMGARSW